MPSVTLLGLLPPSFSNKLAVPCGGLFLAFVVHLAMYASDVLSYLVLANFDT